MPARFNQPREPPNAIARRRLLAITSHVVAGNREIAARQITVTTIEADYTSSDIVRIDCPDAKPPPISCAKYTHPRHPDEQDAVVGA